MDWRLTGLCRQKGVKPDEIGEALGVLSVFLKKGVEAATWLICRDRLAKDGETVWTLSLGSGWDG